MFLPCYWYELNSFQVKYRTLIWFFIDIWKYFCWRTLSEWYRQHKHQMKPYQFRYYLTVDSFGKFSRTIHTHSILNLDIQFICSQCLFRSRNYLPWSQQLDFGLKPFAKCVHKKISVFRAYVCLCMYCERIWNSFLFLLFVWFIPNALCEICH